MNHPAENLYAKLTEAKQNAQLANRPWGRIQILEVFKPFLDEFAGEVRKGAAKERKRANIVPDSEQVYALYPKKVGKEDALRAISAALKKHDLPYLLDKTNQFRECVESWPSSYRYFQDGGDRCPHPASWFNAGRYADDPREWKRHGARNSAPPPQLSLPEPQDWRKLVPEYVNVKDPWASLPRADQEYITRIWSTGTAMAAIPKQVEAEQILRNA